MPMTAMPETVALFNGCGGMSSLLVALGVALVPAAGSDGDTRHVAAADADAGHDVPERHPCAVRRPGAIRHHQGRLSGRA